jgi:streptogrisin C
MIRFNVRAVATAGLAVAMLASTAATAAAADGSADEKAPLDAAISAYQRAYPRISLDAAQRAAEQQDARKALYDELLGKDGATFGGAWFDAPSGVLHIAMTTDDAARHAAELGKQEGIVVEPQLVKRSYDDLLKLSEAVSSPDSELGKAARGNVGIDPETNAVVASVPATQVESLAKSAPDGVQVVADPGIKTEADAGCTSRFACDWTIRSGAAIWRTSRGNNVCSAGFTARDASNTRYTYTAGHCSNGNGVTWGTGGQTIGPMQASMNWWAIDASIIRVTNSWFTFDRGGELYRESSPGRSAAVNGVAPTLSYIWRGDVVCLSGNFTQPNGPNFCGIVGSNMDAGVRGMVRVDGFDACGGDSGAGWYWLTPSGRRIAYGMHSRSDVGCHGSNGGSHSWFSALPMIKAFFTPGLNVELRP